MILDAVASTCCGSSSLMTSDAGRGFSPSRAVIASLALRLDIWFWYCSSASSLVRSSTDSTLSQPRTFWM